jgi:hypothetical protein
MESRRHLYKLKPMLVSQKKIFLGAGSGDQAVGERGNNGVGNRSKKCEVSSPVGVKHINERLRYTSAP